MTEIEPTPFGRELRRRRESSGIAVRELARRADVSEGLWRQYEKGYRMAAADTPVLVRPTATNVAKMAAALDWDVLDAVLIAGFGESEAEAQAQLQDARRAAEAAHQEALVNAAILARRDAETMQLREQLRRLEQRQLETVHEVHERNEEHFEDIREGGGVVEYVSHDPEGVVARVEALYASQKELLEEMKRVTTEVVELRKELRER